MPPDNCIPFPNVEVAVVEKTSSEESLSPALMVEVAVFRMLRWFPSIPPANVEVAPLP